MNLTIFILIAFLLIAALYLIVFSLIIKVNKLSSKMANISYDDVNLLINELKELLTESERVAESLDNSIAEKESILEDINDLIDRKLERLESATINNVQEMNLKDKIINLSNSGKNEYEIAKNLGISVTEVNLVLKMNNG